MGKDKSHKLYVRSGGCSSRYFGGGPELWCNGRMGHPTKHWASKRPATKRNPKPKLVWWDGLPTIDEMFVSFSKPIPTPNETMYVKMHVDKVVMLGAPVDYLYKLKARLLDELQFKALVNGVVIDSPIEFELQENFDTNVVELFLSAKVIPKKSNLGSVNLFIPGHKTITKKE